MTLNRDHLLADAVTDLVQIRGTLIRRLEAEVDRWVDLAGAWLFGSTARGDGGSESDIDILLVAERSVESDPWEEQTSRLAQNIRLWTGNDVQLVEHTRNSFRGLVVDKNPLVAMIWSEGIPLSATTRTTQRSLSRL
ncbi:MAG: nucleotidyltransferase domain-containing protein [Candidatus Dormibacteraceae bacterium]